MDKKYALLGTIWVLVVVGALITHSFFPAYLKEKGDLYESYEYSQMYLENETYSDLIIEYDYVEGYEPNGTAIGIFEEKVEKYTNKEHIESEIDDKISENDTNLYYERNDISELKDTYMDYERDEDTISIHVLYLNGEWEEEEDVLGLSKRPSQIVVFYRVVEEFANFFDESTEKNVTKLDVEAPVLVHEFGHLLSLVGLGYESDHEDSRYKNHCDETEGECVMAGSVEVKENIDKKPPLEFCDLCKEDLQQIRGMEDSFGFEELVSYLIISGQYLVGIFTSAVIIATVDKDVKYRSEYVGSKKSDHTFSREKYSDPDDEYYR